MFNTEEIAGQGFNHRRSNDIDTEHQLDGVGTRLRHEAAKNNGLWRCNDLSIDRSIKEIWRDIPGTRWSASSFGHIASSRGRDCYTDAVWSGHLRVQLPDGKGGQKWTYFNSIIMALFGDPAPSPKHSIWHRNGDPQDNRIENLGWIIRARDPDAPDDLEGEDALVPILPGYGD